MAREGTILGQLQGPFDTIGREIVDRYRRHWRDSIACPRLDLVGSELWLRFGSMFEICMQLEALGKSRQISFDDAPGSFWTRSLLIHGWPCPEPPDPLGWHVSQSRLLSLGLMPWCTTMILYDCCCRNCASKALHQFPGLNVRVDVELAWAMKKLFSGFLELQILSCLTSCQLKTWTL